MRDKLFRQQSLDRVNSPEQLNDYIRVANPHIWLLLIAVTVLLLAFLAWAVLGEVPESFQVNGIVTDGQAICFLSQDQAASVQVGDEVAIGSNGESGQISAVSLVPLSRAEVQAAYPGDYYSEQLSLNDWNVEIQIQASDQTDGLAEIRFTTDSYHPVSFLLN
ncbi:hypothetical protein HCH52_11830 [Oscillospiraceae bacterium HV4-5-C5C]|nr:hypothetical protein [Oscillospiraceae bacterium HV4-5-C5C]